MRALSLRLKTVASLVEGNVIADIGCDHGLLAFDILTAQPQRKVFLSDISKSSLQKAENLFAENGVGLNAEFFVGDGLASIPSAPDTAVIAGMGGHEIISIISSSPFKCNCYVLQPMKSPEAVREFLIESGYKIIYDNCLYEAEIYYDIIKAVKTDEKQLLTPLEIKYGVGNIESLHPDFIKYLRQKKKVYLEVVDNIENPLEKRKMQKNIKEIEKLILQEFLR